MRKLILILLMIAPLLANAEVVDGIAHSLNKNAKTASSVRSAWRTVHSPGET